MVYIHKVYTKFGDQGQTMLANGETTHKDSQRVVAYGDIDELNACLGLVRAQLDAHLLNKQEKNQAMLDSSAVFLTQLNTSLGLIQQELFDLGAELANPDVNQVVTRGLQVHPESTTRLEHELDALNESLSPLKSFILPGGGAISAVVHLARTVCRRAEREIVCLAHQEPVRPEVLSYVNRLSDYLFVVARACTQKLGYQEVLWDQQATRKS